MAVCGSGAGRGSGDLFMLLISLKKSVQLLACHKMAIFLWLLRINNNKTTTTRAETGARGELSLMAGGARKKADFERAPQNRVLTWCMTY